MASENEHEKWVVGVVLGLLGSIAINTGNNIQSLGLQSLKAKTNATRDQENYVDKLDNVFESFNELSSNKKKIRKTSLSMNFNQPSRTVPIDNYNQEGDNTIPVNVESCDNEIQLTSHIRPFSSTKWIIGTLIFVTGSLLNFASYAFAAQSMLASLESIQFVTNILFGKFLLGSHITKQMYLGTCLTVSGTVVAVQFSSKMTLDLNTSDIKKLYSNPAYIVYLCLMVAALALLNMVYRLYEQNKNKNIPMRYTNTVMPLVYAVWSALFGTQSVVQAKVLAELIAVQSTGQEQIFNSWFTYMTIIIWIFTVGVWLKRLNDALSTFDPLFIIPLLQCSFIFFAIVSGGIFFQEFNDFKAGQWIGFCFGVIIMFCGLVLLTPSDNNSKEEGLPRDIVDFLISYNNKGEEVSMIRPPTTPLPSPRMETNDDYPSMPNNLECPTGNILNLSDSTKILSSDLSTPTKSSQISCRHVTNLVDRIDDIQSKTPPKPKLHVHVIPNEPNYDIPTSPITKTKTRTHRRSFAENLFDSVKVAVIESVKMTANESKKIFTSPNGTAVLTNAMSTATEEQQLMAIKRREKVRQICSIIGKRSNQNGNTSLTVPNEIRPLKEILKSYENANREVEDYTFELGEVLDGLKKDLDKLSDVSRHGNHSLFKYDVKPNEISKDKLNVQSNLHDQGQSNISNGIGFGGCKGGHSIMLETRNGELVRMDEVSFQDIK